MKKFSKRMLSLILAIIVIVAMIPTTVFAANDGEIRITNATAGKTYEIYRVFDVSYTGAGANRLYTYKMNADFVPFFKAEYGAAVTDELAASNVEKMDAIAVETFAEKVKTFALENGVNPIASKTATTNIVVFDRLDYGYYMMYPQGGLAAECSLTTTDPTAEIEVKSEYPTIKKEILGENGATNAISKKIGDNVNYRLEAIVPDMTGYREYKFIITDTMDKGLTFNDDVRIQINGANLNAGQFNVNSVKVGDQTVITIELLNFLQHKALAGKKIEVFYSAQLNENAVIGNEGNINTASLEYSNNPDLTTSTDETPETTTTVYTFYLQIEKVDKADPNVKLKDAKFSLWTQKVIPNAASKAYTDPDDGAVMLYLYRENITTDEAGLVIVNLDEGSYYLFEDAAPQNYNLLEAPIKFSAFAVVDMVTNKVIDVTTYNQAVTYDAVKGQLETTIENSKGVKLPSTGGMGITLFVAGGIILMLGASVMLVISKRKNASKQKYR